VAGLSGHGGISIFRTADWQEAARDTDYSDAINGLTFDSSGRLAVAANDNFVRLYDPDFHRIAKVKASGGVHPYSIAFSPDETRLVVGYDDTNNVDILSTSDLGRLASPNTEGIAPGQHLAAVAWAKDGAILAAGTYAQNEFSKQNPKAKNPTTDDGGDEPNEADAAMKKWKQQRNAAKTK
jgi:WD40 repeat protein